MNQSPRDFCLLPLGGTGEIGMNLNLYGHDGLWLMVDCGITFARGDPSLPPVMMADPAFIAERRDDLAGIVITHAHEDHVGAVAHLWPRLRKPVFATAFTLAVLRRKLAQVGLEGRVPLHETHAGMRHHIGPFELEWIALTHSIPEPNALLISTSAGSVLHTGDWKLDDDPVIGRPYARQRLQALGNAGLLGLVCDSTNATVEGHSLSEGAVYQPLLHAIRSATGRVIVACFASNVARLHTLARVARATEREFVLLGRSLKQMVMAARATDHWDPALDPLPDDIAAYLPPDRLLAVATGSQGEAGAALDRLASGKHPDIRLSPGDTVIFSSRTIPGNELTVERLMTRLRLQGVLVIDGHSNGMHASGHPAREELRQLYSWVKPQVLVPVHGAAEHLQAQAELGRTCGIPMPLLGRNGDLFRFSPQVCVQRQVAAVGRLGMLEGSQHLERVQALPA